MNLLGKSWKTTLAGLFQLLAVLAFQLGKLFDLLPETQPDWGVIVSSAIIFFGLLKARDNGVSSEEAGLKTPAQDGELAAKVRALEQRLQNAIPGKADGTTARL